jgi:ATP-dependent RNA helicase DeaD
MENFYSLGLPETLSNSLAAMKYLVPTPIQAQTIPAAIEGSDILGTAQTGTGKTAAYGIPLITYLLNNTKESALVLTPTRELAIQVINLLEQMLGRKTSIRTALIIGGDSMGKQLNQLSAKPRLVVGTPGRINDHLARGTLKFDNTSFLVLDETDRMLDMGFGIQLEQISKFLPNKRQTLMFSATLPKSIQKLAGDYLVNATRVSIGSTIAAADTVEQEIIKTSEADKHNILLQQLDIYSGSCIVFVKTKLSAETLAIKLRDQGHSADAIHGDLRQRNREKVIRCFRSKKNRILVATDIAARGLDIPNIQCVLNYDLPQCEEDFIHRIGRTGRAGLKGNAVSLITPQDYQKWNNICKMMDPSAKLDPIFAVKPKRNGDNRNRKSANNKAMPSRAQNSSSKSSSSFYAKTRNNTDNIYYREADKEKSFKQFPKGKTSFLTKKSENNEASVLNKRSEKKPGLFTEGKSFAGKQQQTKRPGKSYNVSSHNKNRVKFS